MLTRSFIGKLFLLIGFLLIFGLGNVAHAAVKITQAPPGGISPNATQFTLYNSTTTWTATGGAPSPGYFWSATGLPAGLSLKITTVSKPNDTCTLTGTPTVSGAFNAITITVTDNQTRNDSNNSLTIIPSCRFSGSSIGTMAFGSGGSIDPSTTPGPITNSVTGQVNFQCGAGLAYTVAVTNPTGQLQMTGANTIPFTLGIASNTSSSDAALIPLLGPNASPPIPASTIYNYQNFVAGSSSIGPITVKISWGGAAPGSLNATVNVTTAIVTDSCSAPVDGSIIFNIDPSSAGPLTPNTTSNGASPTVMCTRGQPHGVSCTSSHSYLLTIGNDGSTDPIAYTVTGCPASVTGQGFLTSVPINFGLSLNATGPNGYQNAAAGAHSDTITVQVSY